ncbi:MAG TPA: hypothetical protein VIB07_01380 [Nitrososphaera sp.]
MARELAEITSRVLSSLGEPTMQALFWELSSQGVTTNPEEFDIRKFEIELKKIFGDGSNVFMEEIYRQFKEQAEGQTRNKELIVEIDNAEIAPIDRIQRILALKVMT